ncbi:nicotinamide-nucleotide adenylyltransferase [Candidatus Woesearchaeota archaeon]|nr:nicotinamide-nucleotide adenylyltransferase [Candidatus Woesearchaeota archaeon]
MITLFIGRFQPFHNGHLEDIRSALYISSKVIIGIGSSQEKDTVENPFSFEERKEMIKKAVEEDKLEPVEIIAVPDVNDDNKWVDHVEKTVGEFHCVLSGNQKVKSLFWDKDIPVREVRFIHGMNGTDIRQRIQEGKTWNHLVPKSVAVYLDSINAEERLAK